MNTPDRIILLLISYSILRTLLDMAGRSRLTLKSARSLSWGARQRGFGCYKGVVCI